MIFTEVPKDFNPLFEVVGCYVEYGGEILLLHRNNEKSEGGKWGVPGGKVDPGETLPQALVREILEETGIAVAEGTFKYLQPISVRHLRHDFIYHIFSTKLAVAPEVILQPLEHQAYVWSTPQDALQLPLVSDVDGCIKLLYGI